MRKVLILDHSKSVRNTLRERLEYEGFAAEAVDSPSAVQALCERDEIDLVLTDRLPEGTHEGIPFIMLAERGSIEAAVEAVRSGAEDYLTRPIDMNRLLQSIHRVVERSEELSRIPNRIIALEIMLF